MENALLPCKSYQTRTSQESDGLERLLWVTQVYHNWHEMEEKRISGSVSARNS